MSDEFKRGRGYDPFFINVDNMGTPPPSVALPTPALSIHLVAERSQQLSTANISIDHDALHIRTRVEPYIVFLDSGPIFLRRFRLYVLSFMFRFMFANICLEKNENSKIYVMFIINMK